MIQTASQPLEACEKHYRIVFRGHAKANRADDGESLERIFRGSGDQFRFNVKLTERVWEGLPAAMLAQIILR